MRFAYYLNFKKQLLLSSFQRADPSAVVRLFLKTKQRNLRQMMDFCLLWIHSTAQYLQACAFPYTMHPLCHSPSQHHGLSLLGKVEGFFKHKIWVWLGLFILVMQTTQSLLIAVHSNNLFFLIWSRLYRYINFVIQHPGKGVRLALYSQCPKHFHNKQQRTQPAEKNYGLKAVKCLQQISYIL